MPIRDANVDKAAAEAGTTKLPDDVAEQLPVVPPGDARNRQELERAAEEQGGLGADGKAAGKHQEALDKLEARVAKLEADMLAKQSAAEARAEPQADPTQPKQFSAAALDQALVARVAKAAGVLPAQVFDMASRDDGYTIVTVDARKLAVKKGDVK